MAGTSPAMTRNGHVRYRSNVHFAAGATTARRRGAGEITEVGIDSDAARRFPVIPNPIAFSTAIIVSSVGLPVALSDL